MHISTTQGQPLSWAGSAEANPETRVRVNVISRKYRKCAQEKPEGAWTQEGKAARKVEHRKLTQSPRELWGRSSQLPISQRLRAALA